MPSNQPAIHHFKSSQNKSKSSTQKIVRNVAAKTEAAFMWLLLSFQCFSSCFLFLIVYLKSARWLLDTLLTWRLTDCKDEQTNNIIKLLAEGKTTKKIVFAMWIFIFKAIKVLQLNWIDCRNNTLSYKMIFIIFCLFYFIFKVHL